MTQQFTTILAALISPILTAVGAVIVTTWEGRRGKLVYYTNPSIVIVVPLAEHLQHVEMGVVFIENRTRRVIENVVIAHNFHTLYYRIAPAIEMNEVELQGNSKGFKFPRFPARSSVSVYYLFLEPPPGVVLGRIYSDEGNALFLPFALQRQIPSWQRNLFGVLVFIGVWTVLYIIIRTALNFYTISKLLR